MMINVIVGNKNEHEIKRNLFIILMFLTTHLIIS